ncbi:MAG: Abi family protein, partial [Fusobacteriaceae bacterium]
MIYSKPFKSYEEQIELLVNKYELTLKNHDLCLELLKTISYYDLVNGYKDFFMQDGKFIKGVSEMELFLFSLFDKNFQGILFKYSVYAENTFKTKLSYTIAKKFGVNEVEYLDEKNYLSSGYSPKRNKKKLKTLDDIKKVSTSIYTKDPTLHY